MTLTRESRQLVSRVQELRDERDELLDILGIVFDGYRGDTDGCTVVASVPFAVMQEIARRVVGGEA